MSKLNIDQQTIKELFSNKKTDLRRYTFPKGLEVESGGRLLCWCTGTLNTDPLAAMEDSGVPFADYTVRRGDTLCLSQDGVVVDTVELPLAAGAEGQPPAGERPRSGRGLLAGDAQFLHASSDPRTGL